MKILLKIILVGLLLVQPPGRVVAQSPPILGNPGNLSTLTGVANFPQPENDPRDVRQMVWSAQTIEYTRTFLTFDRATADLRVILEPFYPDLGVSLQGIRDKIFAIEQTFLPRGSQIPRSFEAPPRFLDTDMFFGEMRTASEGVNAIDSALRQIAATDAGDPLNSPRLKEFFEGDSPEAIKEQITNFIKTLDEDLKLKLNLRLLTVQVHTVEHDRAVSDFRVRWYWKIREDLYKLFGKRLKLLEGNFSGYSTPTKPTRIPPGLYLARGFSERGRGKPSEMQEMEISSKYTNQVRIERTLRIVYAE